MSSKTKRKYVYQEHLGEIEPPTADQMIGRVLQPRGNNLHQVEDCTGAVYLASMPPKFRRNIWVRRGTFLVLEPIAEGDKVRAEVVRVLSREHVAELRRLGVWPARFEPEVQEKAKEEVKGVTEQLDLMALAGNPNRPPVETETETESESESESGEEASGEGESDADADQSSSDSEAGS